MRLTEAEMDQIMAAGAVALARPPAAYRCKWTTVTYTVERTPGAHTHRLVVQGASLRFEHVTKGAPDLGRALSNLLLVLQRERPPE